MILAKYNPTQKTNHVEFDIYDDKGRRIGLEITKYQYQTDNNLKGHWMADLQQTRNGKTYGGSSTWKTLPTEKEADDFIRKNIPLIEKKYSKKWSK